ncbi:hypothetical protein COU54_03420 [Candidatus Pacearchaeota archaeon CG10_big_fil_rev_8_21_14_0_10_31_24]|nr:MAG: hypothetical protein COU54_03420 [Candidatus Pacearchaeota archaeon CG10_big_fil_rev_8_21_14_0_10_31_24]
MVKKKRIVKKGRIVAKKSARISSGRQASNKSKHSKVKKFISWLKRNKGSKKVKKIVSKKVVKKSSKKKRI